MDRRSIEFIQDVLITIHDNIRELNERLNFADPEERAYIQGKLQAYSEILSTLRSGADEFGISRSDLGL